MAYRNPRYMVAHALRDRGDENVTVSGADAETPQSRLGDGLIARPFRFDVSAADHFIAVDLGIIPESYSRAIIPAGHTLDGATWVIEEDDADDFATATTLGTDTFSGTGLQDLAFTPSGERYLRLRIVDAGLWTLTELYITNSETTSRGPTPQWVDAPGVNVNVTTLRSGEEYGNRLGEQRRELAYTYNRLTGSDLALFELLLAATDDGSFAFYLDRTNDTSLPMMVRLAGPLSVSQDRPNPRATGESYRIAIAMRESLA